MHKILKQAMNSLAQEAIVEITMIAAALLTQELDHKYETARTIKRPALPVPADGKPTVHLFDVAVKAQIPIARAESLLHDLELEGRVRRLPGDKYMAVS